MSPALPAGIPPIEETSQSRQGLLDALSNQVALPSGAVAIAALYAETIEPDVLAVLERARMEDLDWPSERLLFRGLHILGGRRLPAAYRPLIAFLRGSGRRVEALFGDAITETLPKILAGLFDGDEEPLRALITDASVDPFVREAALKALGFLAFDGRIDRTGFEAFLLRFDQERLVPSDDQVMWHGWMSVVAALGIAKLAPRVQVAFADGRIPLQICDEAEFDQLLKAALERPDDRTRLDDEQMGYIEDVLVALEQFPEHDAETSEVETWDDDEITDDDLLKWAAGRVPAHNPLRGVGRNDPCPCGSGKKAKRCCLRS